MDRDEIEHLRDPEDRALDNCNEQQRKDKAMDKILAESFQPRFALEDGRVLDGPAVHPQPCLETRVRNGRIEVRKPICKTPVVEPGTAGATELSKSA